MSRNSKFILDQLLTVKLDDFLGTENEFSFLSFILAASPMLKKMPIRARNNPLTKSAGTYQKLYELKKSFSQVAITYVLK